MKTDALKRLIRRWELASARYNRDCNMRTALPYEEKRKHLRDRSERSFERMIAHIKASFGSEKH